MNEAEATVIIQRARHATEPEFLPPYDTLAEAAEVMLPARLGDDEPGIELTRHGFDKLREDVDDCMARSCPFTCTGVVKLWKLAALFRMIDELGGPP